MNEIVNIICGVIFIGCVFALGFLIRNIIKMKKNHQPILKHRVVNASPQHQEALIDTLTGHQDAIESLAFKPDGSTLVSADYVGEIILWDVKSKQSIRQLTGHEDAAWSLAFTVDGKTLATSSDDGTIKLWNTDTDQLQSTLINDPRKDKTVAFTADGQTLLSYSSDDKTIEYRDVATGQLNDKLLDSHDPLDDVTVNSHSNLLASISGQHIIVWDVEKKSIQKKFMAHEEDIAGLGFSKNGELLASASWDDTIKIWDSYTGTLLHTIELVKELNESPEPSESIAFSPNGELLAFTSTETIVIWSIPQHKILTQLIGHADTVQQLAFSPDGNTLASGSDDTTIKLWNVKKFH